MCAKRVETVAGPVDPQQLGFTLTHEHLSMQLDHFLFEPLADDPLDRGNCPIDQQHRPWILQNQSHHRSNMILNDEEAEAAILHEVKLFKAAGGGTLVDQTSWGLRRKNRFLLKLAKESGVNVVAGAGFYTYKTQEDLARNMSLEQMTAFIRQQFVPKEDGFRCGLIGEIGCNYPLHEWEMQSMKASALVQAELSCPVLIHPPHTIEGLREVLRIYLESGGREDKLTIAHLDYLCSPSVTMEFAGDSGRVKLELDTFGAEVAIDGYPPYPSDSQRINLLLDLVKEGFEDRILLSHDIFSKCSLSKYGGHGYSHLLRSTVPAMTHAGLSAATVHKFNVDNPREWLTF